ncbi:MAG: hypothetical protein ACFCVK_04505 [Acidimicrobiales bacterium]
MAASASLPTTPCTCDLARRPADLSVDPDSFVERTAEIEDAAQQAAASTMNLWELFRGGLVDPDDQLVQIFGFVNALQLGSAVPLEKRYQGEHGDWILVGEIRQSAEE